MHSFNFIIIILIFIIYRVQSLDSQPRVIIHWFKSGGGLVIEPLLEHLFLQWRSLIVFKVVSGQVLLESHNTLVVQVVGKDSRGVVVHLIVTVTLLLKVLLSL